MRARSVVGSLVCALAAALALAFPAGAQESGDVVRVEPMPESLRIPGSSAPQRITYWSTGVDDTPALSSGAVFTPDGPAPAGGWPVVAWAHGTVGLGDACAPSLVGPAAPEREKPYLGRWIAAGYAVVATDYVGLGTPGLMPYLDGKVQAHSVVDAVKAAVTIDDSLSDRWAVVGQSQGGGAAITTAHYATRFGGPDLDFRGAVGTGVPANIELALLPLGPGFAPVPLSPNLTTYLSYILAGLRFAHPEIDLNSYLTPEGRHFVDRAETECIFPLAAKSSGIVTGGLFTKPLNEIPNFYALLNAYMGVPTSGYDRPLFIGQGAADLDVPAPSALSLLAQMTANNVPVTFKMYQNDHIGTGLAAQADAIAFVNSLMG
ncbi:alpha/beta hydrolase family protein [Rhodococcoides trifolii]